MYTIKPKKSNQLQKIPTASDLALGELAVNITNNSLFFKKTDNSVVGSVSTTLTNYKDFLPAGTLAPYQYLPGWQLCDNTKLDLSVYPELAELLIPDYTLTSVTTPNCFIYDYNYLNNLHILISLDNIYTSADLISWNAYPLNLRTYGSIGGRPEIIYNPVSNLYFIPTGVSPTGSIYSTSNFSSFSSGPIPSTSGIWFLASSDTTNSIFGLDTGGRLYRSTNDGSSWSNLGISIGSGRGLFNFVRSGTEYLAVLGATNFQIHPITNINVTSPFFRSYTVLNNLAGYTWLNNELIIVPISDNKLYVSDGFSSVATKVFPITATINNVIPHSATGSVILTINNSPDILVYRNGLVHHVANFFNFNCGLVTTYNRKSNANLLITSGVATNYALDYNPNLGVTPYRVNDYCSHIKL